MNLLKRYALLLLLLCPQIVWAQASEDAADPRNILFIIADDLSAEALGCYGNADASTPNIDRLAQRGMVFERAYCQYPVCGPARAALLSGLYPQQNKVTGNSDRDILSSSLGDRPTLPEHFKNNGYSTVRLGKLYHMRVPGHITAGIDGPDHPASWSKTYNFKSDEQWTPGRSELLTNEKLRPDPDRNIHYGLGYGAAFYVVEDPTDGAAQHDVRATDKAIELMGQLKNKPFFLAVGYVRPHVPFVAPTTYFDRFDVDTLKLPHVPRGDRLDIPKLGIPRVGERQGLDTDAKRRRSLQAYYASVSFMDAQVGRLLDALDKQGLTDNTLIVFLSDHGYHLGEHDFWQKMSLHEESARIPLVLSGPGIAQGSNAKLVVESIDLYPSLASAAGLPVPAHCVGLDLTDVSNDARDFAYTLCRGGHLIRTVDWAYMRYKDGSEALYDMKKDPKQFRNLAKDADSAESLDLMRKKLETKLKQIDAK